MLSIILICGLIVLGSLVAFRPTLDAGLLNWDDDRNFLTNTQYRGLGADNFKWAWRTYHMGVWQPAAWVLLGAEHVIAGVDEAGHPNPEVYHAFSIAIHTANGLLLFALLVILLRVARSADAARDDTALVVAGGAAAMLFVVHPLRTEAVAWISGQPYLPAVFFAMLAMIVYVVGMSMRTSKKAYVVTLVLTFVLFCIAVMFKAVAISLPVLLLILDAYPLRRMAKEGGRPAWRALCGLIAEKVLFLLVAINIARFASQSKTLTQPGADVGGLPLVDRIVQSCYGLMFYLAKSIVPTGLSPFYELPKSFSLADPRFGGAVVFVVIGVIALIVFRKRAAAIAACLAAYVVILLPNLGVVQISQQLVADRYSYFASVPLAALVAGAICTALSRGPVELRRMRFMGVGLAVVFASLSLIRVSRTDAAAWHDSKSLWSRALALDPDSPHAHCNLGAALIAEGDYPAAEDHLREAIKQRNDFVFAYSNLGLVLMEMQEWREAVSCYDTAMMVLSRLPAEDREKTLTGLAFARYELGIELTQQEDWRGVVDCYEKLMPGIDRLPLNLQAQVEYGLAVAYFELGDQKQGWKHLREAQKRGIPSELIEQATQRY